MNYRSAIVVGNHPQISAAEAQNVFGAAFLLGKNVALTSAVLKPEDIHKLGGASKIVSLIDEVKELTPHVLLRFLPSRETKLLFALSVYEYAKARKTPRLRKTGYALKKLLKEKGRSARLLTSDEAALSSVTVTKNKLLEKGVELCIIVTRTGYLIGKTIAVQDFENYSKRDYGRPARDDRSGMLPPKLAQMMINLAGTQDWAGNATAPNAKTTDPNPPENTTLLDPFCGSGTILQEAALLGYRNIIGSDASKKAIEDSRKNIHWLQKHYPQTESVNFQLIHSPIEKLSEHIKPGSINKIVFEGYLGPPSPRESNIQKNIAELNDLYKNALTVCATLLTSNGTIVAALPSWHFRKKSYFLATETVIPDTLKIKKLPEQGSRKSFLYGRTNQTVKRAIFVLGLSRHNSESRN